MRAAVKVLLDAVKERGLSFCLRDGKANLRGDRKEVTPELLAALKHFRGELLEATGIKEEVEQPPVVETEAEQKKAAPQVPPNAVIVVADKDGYTDKNMRAEPYTWTWIGAETWIYVKDHPIPKRS